MSHKCKCLDNEHKSSLLNPNSLDKCRMYICHFVRMDIKLDRHNFFCKDHTRRFKGIYHSFWSFNSSNKVIYKRYINYWPSEAYLQDIHIFQFGCCIKMKVDMRDICWYLSSNGMVDCRKYIFLRICKVRYLDRHIIIFLCRIRKYQDIFHMLYFCDSSILERYN